MRICVLFCAVLAVTVSNALVLPSVCESAFRRALDADATWRMERRLKGSDKTLVSTGMVSCAAKKGIIWDVRYPFPETISMTTNEMIIVNEDARVVKSLSDLPHYERIRKACDAFLEGDDKAFDGMFEAETRFASNGVWSIVFKPSRRQIRRFLARVEVSGLETLSRVVIESGDGSSSLIEFKETARGTHSLWKDR